MFENRQDAGIQLAERLRGLDKADTVVLGLPRGGVVVAAEVARDFGFPLDIAVAKKIGHPQNPEAAIGAVSDCGQLVLSDSAAPWIDPSWLEDEIANLRRQAELTRTSLMGSTPPIDLRHKRPILVDDGIATGHTLRAAIASVKYRGAQQIVVAVPVGPPETLATLRQEAEEVISILEPEDMQSVGAYYRDFEQVSDDEVRELLRQPRS